MLTKQHRGRIGPFLLAGVLVLAALSSGCGIFSPDESDDGGGGGGGGEPYPLATGAVPDGPDQLIANFVRSYNERNYNEYDNLIHENFEFRFAVEDVDLSGDPEGVWDRARDAQSTWNMFNDVAGKDPITGAEQAPIQKINLTLNPVNVWEDEVPPDFAGTWVREYSVIMQVDYTDGNGAAVQGLQRFYVAPVSLDLGDDGSITVWQLKFWQDLGKDSAG